MPLGTHLLATVTTAHADAMTQLVGLAMHVSWCGRGEYGRLPCADTTSDLRFWTTERAT